MNNSDGAACISLTERMPQGSVAIIESTFIGQVGRSALSLSNHHDGTNNMSISNSIFAHNNASGFGGAIIFDGGLLAISGSTFTSNSASGIGGALCVRSGNVVVNDSSFVGNTAVTVYSTESRYQEGGCSGCTVWKLYHLLHRVYRQHWEQWRRDTCLHWEYICA